MDEIYVVRSRIDRYYRFPYIGIYTTYEAAEEYVQHLQNLYPDHKPGFVAEVYPVKLNTVLYPE